MAMMEMEMEMDEGGGLKGAAKKMRTISEGASTNGRKFS